MIVSNSFIQSLKARDSEFTTCVDDRPLIVQFASRNSQEFADAAEIVAPFADGADLNCGCPQRWAMADGYGACLLKKPELIQDMVRQARARVSGQDFTVSIKIRIHNDLRETVDLCQKAEHAGVSWISVHGRTKEQRAHPVNYDAIKLIKESVSLPVIANGDIKSLEDCQTVYNITGVDGVMAARGMLQNPAMYAGHADTPISCVTDWVNIAMEYGASFTTFHQHLIFMMERIFSRAERRVFNSLASTSAVLEYLREHYDIGLSDRVESPVS
ncbi:hypothetical protein FSP39_004005 [Pinctada imbricata]|uniref:DUS-like FMN-binding domain-containing protein n=1 Tax=Pinctada imbricata TaxID=66713 RepID=A0AA89C9V0_PINIB|nr:hypothetical protein FSP39_004005 [Pinctada imbricata]